MTDIKKTITADRERIFAQLKELVSFNSVHGAEGSESAAAAAWVRAAFEDLGFDMQTFDTADGSTALLGTLAGKPGARTVLLYSHYDVVAAGNRDAWESDPFELTERTHADGSTRWYGRGAADCKGNIAMHLAALRAVKAAGGTDLNLKILIEGSEEQGGEGLSHLIEERPELFAADAIMIADAGNSQVGQPTLTTSLRGGGQIAVQVDTLHAAVHSGQFGGAAPDAVKALMRTLDSLYDEAGRTVIDGVDCAGTWEGEPYPAAAFRQDAQMIDGTNIMGGGETAIADLVWARPALTVTGFTSTPFDEAVNAVPATAKANVNLRVPAGMDAAATAKAVVAHLEAHVPWGAKITAEVLEANDGFSTDPQAPAIALLGQCLSEAYGGTATTEQGMGGSIPLTTELQEKHPAAEIALYGVEDPKAVIHSANESVDPTEIENVAIAEALFLTRF
ncbi:peptidase M20 [Corynebacterium phocae]|uniref:Peptidase M20 n=1 Tax=Corynebacterium phocae TaxID=161895 RepID=A0A1L7D5F1_9CORY|nr:M20/M25/M40 family metallo-hydrolase [Corynebacterium phocae]APT93297.1 peptidase M20 [Corynebacterium phocae]KAA8721626.1 M20/M25/M40 family metallo-hydrolase [Corynebacterium phocae]